MSRVLDVSGKLGEYMLKGWVLTDSICPTAGCNVPLLRTPAARFETKYYCANCESDPDSQATPIPVASTTAPSTDSSTHHSRPSTPPTEISSVLSSPTFAPPIETAEHLRRRQQSDYASAEIGRRLLQGYAMLADECPRATCYGVPLVRPPRPGGGKDPRKQCVVCETVYVSERNANGIESLAERAPQQTPESSAASANTVSGARSTVTQNVANSNDRLDSYSFVSPNQPGPNGTTVVPFLHPSITHENKDQLSGASPTPPTRPDLTKPVNVFDASITSLENALLALSEKLNGLTCAMAISDTTNIGATADAMGRVAQALSHIRQASRG